MSENREQELLKKIESNKEKRIQNAANESKLRAIEEEDAAYQAELEQIQQAKSEQEAAQQTRIEEATMAAAFFLDNLVIEGLTMRELCAGEDQYQMLRIAVQTDKINQAEEYSKQINAIQAEENTQKSLLKQQLENVQKKQEEDNKQAYEDMELIKHLESELAQSKLETIDYQTKLRNATDEIDRLNSHVDDLRKEIAVGARNAYKVIDSEEQGKQMKELADRIKASRIHVYDVVPDSEINAKNYTAKRADNGEEVTYNWTQAKNYIEIKDPNEVEQFRQQFANKEAVSDSALGNEEVVNVTPEVTFPEIPSAIAPEVNVPAEVQLVISTPTDGGQGQTVEERLSALEAHVFGFVKQAVA